MDKIMIILNEGPNTMRSWNGIRLAGGILDVNLETQIVLFDEAVFCAKKGQNPPDDLEGLNLAKKLSDLIKLGVKILVCGSCCQARGVKKEELIDGVEICCLTDVANGIKTSKQTLIF
ncbi:MAG: DsrE family protein [Candidatus Omnitrophica bacterium]|nr:DsrE family protein [Candidatus Omnitrophota bacterium]